MNTGVAADMKMDEETQAENSPEGAISARLERPRVLVVDDEPSVIKGIQAALHDRPYRILGATSARAALATLQSKRIDVVVADERMPGVTGTQLLCIVARDYPQTGRIVLTGQASVEAAARAINHARVVRFLMKPCKPHVLCAAIDAALVAREPGAAASNQPTGRGHLRRVSICGRESDAMGVEPEQTAIAVKPVAQDSSDILLYAQRSVRLDSPAVPRGLEILSWVRTNLGGVLTLEEFASIGDGRLRGGLMAREAIHRTLIALQPRAEVLRSLGITVSLAVASEWMSDTDFVRFLVTALSRSQVADRVTVRLDSPPAARDWKKLTETLHIVCRAGCRLGVGGVSATPFVLRALQGLPVARITIDRRLSDEVVTNCSARAEVSAIVEHARGAGVETAASFVATSAAARELRTLGVDYGQGYAFGAPVSLAVVLANLEQPA